MGKKGIESITLKTADGTEVTATPERMSKALAMIGQAPGKGFQQYRVPGWIRGLRHVAAKDKKLFNFHNIYFFSDGIRFRAAASDGSNAILITGPGDWRKTPEHGLLLPMGLFGKCRARLDSAITIDWPDQEPSAKSTALVTATWMQQKGKNAADDFPMRAGLQAPFGLFPTEVLTELEGVPGDVPPRGQFATETVRTICDAVRELADQDRFTIRAVNPSRGAPCDVLFPRAPALADCEVRFLVRTVAPNADDSAEA